ncbi:hypothetical protein [Nannocystis punicea]|uniref:Transposase n=1 Tax=Nannocystis punicea TaxID=2995304 RepID=A0ABY7H8A2_9BACT|nr:hypothetical protein [Nannocystis poenicansa]WAS95269.1 hypothetical protein O0S08_03840 [Nannocystis poenicansa]
MAASAAQETLRAIPNLERRVAHERAAPNNADQKAGLERFARAVAQARIAHKPKEKPEDIASRIEFCALWIEGDTLESFRLRTRRWAAGAIQQRLSVIRRLLGTPKHQHHKPYGTAQAFIQMHESRNGR